MAERNPLERVTSIWDASNLAQREHIQFIWPDLYTALSRLSEANSRVITNPASVRVPTIGSPVPASGSRGRSAGRSGASGMEPTSTPGVPGQMPLPLDLEEGK